MAWEDIENGENGETVRAKINALGRGAAPVPGTDTLLFQLKGANLNSTADQIFEKRAQFGDFVPTSIRAMNASTPISGAVGGIYTQSGKSGTSIINASQAWSGLTSTVKVIHPALVNAGMSVFNGDLYLSLSTPMGSTATCDIYVIGFIVP